MSELVIESDYLPTKKGIVFHSSSAKYKFLVGGYGSGKTRMGVEEIQQLMLENPGIEIVVMRKTMPALRDTTMHEFMSIIPEGVGRLNRRLDNFEGINGSKIMFRGLDEPSKFRSLNVAIVVFDEADEFTYEDFQTMNSRIRQSNKDKKGKPYPLHFMLILNPVDENHWIYKTCVTNAENLDKEGGLLELHLSTLDNKENLPAGYIEQIMATMTADEQDRYIHGNWGQIIRGEPVYTDIFRKELHMKDVKYQEGFQIQRGWDFGFNHPACVIRIKDGMGRRNIYREILGEKEHLDVFARKVLQKCEQLFGKYAMFSDFCDPRGHDKSDKGATSVEILNDLGVYPVGERGIRAYVEPGIKCVRHELSTLVQGVPLLTVNPECPIMLTAFGGAYVRDETGQIKKDGYYEHLMDADRYTSYQDKSNDAVKMALLKRKKRTPRNAYTGY